MRPRRLLLTAAAAILLALPALALGSVLRLALEQSTPAHSLTGRDTQTARSDEAAGGGLAEMARSLVTQEPSLSLADESVRQSGDLRLSANGLEPNEPVVVQAVLSPATERVELHRGTADGQGKLPELHVRLPEAVTSGERLIRVFGEQSGRTAEAVAYVRADKPYVVLKAKSVRPPDKVGFVAGGFEPEEQVRVAFGKGETISTAELTADRAGNTSWSELALPSYEPGEYDLVLVGAQSGVRATRTVLVEPLKPELELSPWYGPPGRPLELNGRGFLPDETVSVAYDGVSEGEFKADEYGNFWGVQAPDVPYEARQALTVTLEGGTSGARVSAEFKVADPKPWVELSTYAGPPGTAVYVSGGGWTARERVRIYLGETTGRPVGGGTANEEGYLQFAGPAPIPADAPDEIDVVVVGDDSGAAASAVFTVVRPYVPGLEETNPRQPAQPPIQLPTPYPTPAQQPDQSQFRSLPPNPTPSPR